MTAHAILSADKKTRCGNAGTEGKDYPQPVVGYQNLWLRVPKTSSPNVPIGDPVPVSPGFPLKTCGNDGTLRTQRLCGESRFLSAAQPSFPVNAI